MHILCSFEINQKAGPREHDKNIFHFKTYLSVVVCNTFGSTGWEKEQIEKDAIFAEGEAFDIFMLTSPGHYDVRSLKKQNEFKQFN